MVATPVPDATTRFCAVHGVVEARPDPPDPEGHVVLHVPPKQICEDDTVAAVVVPVMVTGPCTAKPLEGTVVVFTPKPAA